MANSPSRALPRVLSGWQFCPRCSGKLERVVGEAGAQPHLHCLECAADHYGNPAPTASVFAMDAAGRLLLVRRAIEPSLGMWDTPGGFVEAGEDGDAAAVRELEEETGLHARDLRFLCAVADEYGPAGIDTFNLFYAATVDDPGAAVAASDVADLAWLGADELPADHELAFDSVRTAMTVWRESLRGLAVG